MEDYKMNIQLFAEGEGADGDGANAGDINNGSNRHPANGKEDLSEVIYGKVDEAQRQITAGDANDGSTNGSDDDFESLIKGKYKDQYGKKVQEAIQHRFKQNAESDAKLAKLNPILEALGQKYGVDGANIDEISKHVLDDDSLYEDEAMERGLSVETLKEIKAMERENQQYKEREAQSAEEMRMREHFEHLARQSEELKQQFPDFDLRTEMQNPNFARMVMPDVNVPLRNAFLAIHGDEIQQQTMQYAAQRSAERVSNAVRSGSMRPTENGLSGRQNGRQVRSDPSQYTKADIDEIVKRAGRGARIVFD